MSSPLQRADYRHQRPYRTLIHSLLKMGERSHSTFYLGTQVIKRGKVLVDKMKTVFCLEVEYSCHKNLPFKAILHFTKNLRRNTPQQILWWSSIPSKIRCSHWYLPEIQDCVFHVKVYFQREFSRITWKLILPVTKWYEKPSQISGVLLKNSRGLGGCL